MGQMKYIKLCNYEVYKHVTLLTKKKLMDFKQIVSNIVRIKVKKKNLDENKSQF